MDDELDIDGEFQDSAEEVIKEKPAARRGKAKKSGGGFFKLLVVMAVIAGGLYFAVQSGMLNLQGILGSAVKKVVPEMASAPIAADASINPAPAQVEDLLAIPEQPQEGIPVPQIQDFQGGDLSGNQSDIAGANAAPIDILDEVGVPVPPMPETMDPSGLAVIDVTNDVISSAEVASQEEQSLLSPADDMLGTEIPVVETHRGIVAQNLQPPVEDLTVIDDKNVVETAGVQAPAVQAGTAQTGAVQAMDDSRVLLLEQRMGDLEKTVAEMKAALPAAQDIVALKAAMDDLRQDLKRQADDSKAAVAEAAQVRAKAQKSEALREAKREVENYRHGIMPEVVHAAKKTTTPKKTSSKEAAKPSVKPSVPSIKWILKSAKPDMAWIAPQGSQEMKTVTVGDNIQGLGRVTSIAKDDAGRWVVTGTSGFVRQ